MRNKIYNSLVVLIFLELVLGGLGNLFGLPIRKVLFVLGIGLTLYMIYKEKIKINSSYIKIIIIVGIYALYGSVVGIIRGNSFGSIFSDVNSFLGIVYILLLIVYFGNNFKNIDRGISIIANASFVVAVITLFLFFFSRIFLPSDERIILAYMKLEEITQYGFISGLVNSNNYARVFLYNGIFMEIGALIYSVRLLSPNCEKKISTIIKTFLLFAGVYVSSTRGFWLGTAVGVCTLVLYYLIKKKERNFTGKRLVVVALLLLALVWILPKTYSKTAVIQTPTVSSNESVKGRIESMVDFKEDPSNQVRLIQLKFIMNAFKESPIFGYGFGATLTEYSDYMLENNNLIVGGSNFELYYLELLYKTGIVGIIYFFGYLAYKFVQLLKVFFTKNLDELDERVLMSWTIAFIAFLASSVTNPYLAGLAGFFVLIMEAYILETVLIKYE